MKGRRPKPTRLKAVAGNPGKRPLNKREPKPKRIVPQPPDYLPDDAQEIWQQVVDVLDRMGVLTEADVIAVEGLVVVYWEWRQAIEALKRDGFCGNDCQRSSASIAASDAWKRLRLMLSEFGMTPSARTRVQVVADLSAEESDARDFFGV